LFFCSIWDVRPYPAQRLTFSPNLSRENPKEGLILEEKSDGIGGQVGEGLRKGYDESAEQKKPAGKAGLHWLGD